MNTKRNLLAVVVSVLTVGCALGATGISPNAEFAVIPDNEAIQILGGYGWECNTLKWAEDYWPCGDTENDCSYWIYWYETWQCGPALSGECDPYATVTGLRWGGCVWYPEVEGGVCERDGTAEDVTVYGCN